MDIKLQKKWDLFLQAFASFEAVLEKNINDEFLRDSAIQRFEYTIEIFWKVLKIFLENENIEVTSPRDVIKKACTYKFITEEESEKILEMLRIRNQTSHDYAMSVAKSLAPELRPFASVLKIIIRRLKEKILS